MESNFITFQGKCTKYGWPTVKALLALTSSRCICIYVFFFCPLVRRTSSGQSNYVKILPKLSQLISQLMNETPLFSTQNLVHQNMFSGCRPFIVLYGQSLASVNTPMHTLAHTLRDIKTSSVFGISL